MGQITLDRQLVEQTCECCEQVFQVVRGHAYDEEDYVAIYLAGLHACTGEHRVHLAIALREGYKDLAETCAIALQVWATTTSYEMFVMNMKQCPWQSESYLGRMMDREEALRHALLDDFFHIADHVAQDNPEIMTYLSR